MAPMGLTEFLMARIAEDEEAAGAVKDIGTDVWSVEVTVLRALALPFAGHPDFREEWNP